MDNIKTEDDQDLENKKSTVRRILLDQEIALATTELVSQLRIDSCKADASKLVNMILSIFFEKYSKAEYKNLIQHFFDKKNYLKKLINSTAAEDIDVSIQRYLERHQAEKKRARKLKNKAKKEVNDSSSGS